LTGPLLISMVIVFFVLLLVLLLFLPYLTILRQIAAFSYPNARFYASGNPFVKKDVLKRLAENTTLGEIASDLSSIGGYSISLSSSAAHGDTNSLAEFEKKVENETIRFLTSAVVSVPDEVRPFFRAFLLRMDARQIKSALRSTWRGGRPDITHVFTVTPEIADRLRQCSSPEEIVEVLSATPFGQPLREASEKYGSDRSMWEMAVDRTCFERMNSSLNMVNDLLRPPLTKFFGHMVDVYNILLCARVVGLGLSGSVLNDFFLEGGREIKEWRWKRMREAPDLRSMLQTIADTSYSQAVSQAISVLPPATGKPKEQDREKILMALNTLERTLMTDLISRAREVSSTYSLFAGPAVAYVFLKEVEMRNILAVAMGMVENRRFDDVEKELIFEGGV